MAYNLPVPGEPNWGTKLNNSIEALKADVDAAVANADQARGNSIVALNEAQAAKQFVQAPTDGQVASLVADPESETGASLLAAVGASTVPAPWTEILPTRQGVIGDYTGRNGLPGVGTDARQAVQAALDAATDPPDDSSWYEQQLRRRTVTVELPPGVYVFTAPVDGSPSLRVPRGVTFDTSKAMLFFDYPAVETNQWCAIQLEPEASLRVGYICNSGRAPAPGSKNMYDAVRAFGSDNWSTWITGAPNAEIRSFQGACIRLVGTWVTHLSGIRFRSRLGVIASQLPANNVYGWEAPSDMPAGANRAMTDLYITDCYFQETTRGGFVGPISGNDAAATNNGGIGGDLDFTKGALQLYMTRCVFEHFNNLPVRVTGYNVSFVDCAWEQCGNNTGLAAWLQTVRSVYVQNFRFNLGGGAVPGPGGATAVPESIYFFRADGVQSFIIDGGQAFNNQLTNLSLVRTGGGSFPPVYEIAGVHCDVNDFVKNELYGGHHSINLSARWSAPFRLRGYYLWMGDDGRLRIKSSTPASDSDGLAIASTDLATYPRASAVSLSGDYVASAVASAWQPLSPDLSTSVGAGPGDVIQVTLSGQWRTATDGSIYGVNAGFLRGDGTVRYLIPSSTNGIRNGGVSGNTAKEVNVVFPPITVSAADVIDGKVNLQVRTTAMFAGPRNFGGDSGAPGFLSVVNLSV